MGSIAIIIQFIQLFELLLPLAKSAIQTVESAVPQSGQGSAKLAAVKSIMAGAFNSFNATLVTFDYIWPALEASITAMVGVMNVAGVLSKKVADNVAKIETKVTAVDQAVQGLNSPITGTAAPVIATHQ